MSERVHRRTHALSTVGRVAAAADGEQRLQAFYYDGKPTMSDEEFENLEQELLWEGSRVAILRCLKHSSSCSRVWLPYIPSCVNNDLQCAACYVRPGHGMVDCQLTFDFMCVLPSQLYRTEVHGGVEGLREGDANPVRRAV